MWNVWAKLLAMRVGPKCSLSAEAASGFLWSLASAEFAHGLINSSQYFLVCLSPNWDERESRPCLVNMWWALFIAKTGKAFFAKQTLAVFTIHSSMFHLLGRMRWWADAAFASLMKALKKIKSFIDPNHFMHAFVYIAQYTGNSFASGFQLQFAVFLTSFRSW